jgi:glucose-1-phosphate thymidylyltransferase
MLSDRKGLIMAGGRGKRLSPLTNAMNKHLLPIYDKPMIYYPLSTLMLCGIREIAIIVNTEDLDNYKLLLGNGEKFGIKIDYFVQDKPLGIPDGLIKTKKWISDKKITMILGDNIFVGPGLGRQLSSNLDSNGAVIFGSYVSNPSDYGIVEFDQNYNIVSLEEKPLIPKSRYAIPGLYFLDERAPEIAESLKTSARGELEIVDLLKNYLDLGSLQVKIMHRGNGWMDCGSIESLFRAGEFVRIIQHRQGIKFLSPEEISFTQGWITEQELATLTQFDLTSEYSVYLDDLMKYHF